MNVVPLRSEPLLNDIAGSLRALADRVEVGEVAPRTLLVIWDDSEVIVRGACVGAVPDRFGLVGMLRCAASKAETGQWG